MSVEQSSAQAPLTKTLDEGSSHGVYGALFAKINLSPVAHLSGIEAFQNSEALSEASADERVTAAVSVFLNLLQQSTHKVERLMPMLTGRASRCRRVFSAATRRVSFCMKTCAKPFANLRLTCWC